MKLIDIVTGPWAIEPEKLNEIVSLYDSHLKREKIDLDAVEARIGRPLGRKEQGYDVVNGIAVIPVDGVIAKRANLFHKVSGGASTELIKRDFEMAMADPDVESILLDIDSPGGSVDGTKELADAIYEARGDKPIVAFANGTMASAAYWIGSAADEIYASPTAAVGSIGVVAQHVDTSKAQKKAGIKRTEIYAGKYKRIASENEPLSEEGRADIQAKVDYLYSVFVSDVARHRGKGEDNVLKDMADGRVFIGKQAFDAGLVDGVSNFDSVLARMASGDLSNNSMEDDDMSKADNKEALTRDVIAEQHPEVFEAIRKEGFEAGVAAETDRIKAVFDVSMPGHEALIESLAFDGKTTGPEAAVAVLKAEKEKGGKVLEAMKADAEEVNNVDASAADEPEDKSFEALVSEKMEADGVSRAAAIVAVARDYPEAHAKYLKGMEE